MLTKRTKTTETFILPEEFETYSKKDFVIFMSRPTCFGTYKAVKIELIEEQGPAPAHKPNIKNIKSEKSAGAVSSLWNMFSPASFKARSMS